MKLSHINFPDGSKLIPIQNGLYDYFPEKKGWEGWTRVRFIKGRMLIVSGDLINNSIKLRQVFNHLTNIHTKH